MKRPKTRRSGQIISKGRGEWRIRWYLGQHPGTGKRRYASETVKGTKRDAEKRLEEVLGNVDAGVVMTSAGTTVGQMLQDWLGDEAAQAQRHVRTLHNYRGNARLYIEPSIGRQRVDRLTPDIVSSRLIYPLLRDGHKRTAEQARAVLSAALEWAAETKRYGINANPIRGSVRVKGESGAPEQGKYARRALTREQVVKLRGAIEDSGNELLFLTLLATAMRPSEALGLQWRDIALSTEDRERWEGDEDPLARQASFGEGACLLVRRTLIPRGIADWSDGPVFGPPKTKSGYRVLPLPGDLVRRLKAHKLDQSRRRLMGRLPHYGNDLVFVGRSGQPSNQPSIRAYQFKRALKKAGLPDSTRLYDLRHTAITHAVRAATRQGEAITSVSEWAGHASLKQTLDLYTHASEEGTRSVAQGVAESLLG